MKFAVVTGGNRGIGLEFCRQLADQGYGVLALCRRSSDELDALAPKVKVEIGIDVSDDSCVERIRSVLQGARVDLLINNAGLLTRETLEEMDWNKIRKQFEVNALGPLRVVQGALEGLQSGSKVAMVTSRMGSIADNTSGARYGYRMSKAALNMGSVSLAHDLKSQGVAVGIFHPGYVRTEMTGGNGNLDPQEAAAGILQGVEKLNLDQSGSFWHSNGESLPW